MPMNELRSVGVVVNIDGDTLAFLETQQRTWKLPVVEGSRDNVLGRQLDEPRCNTQCVVGRNMGLR